MWNTIRPVEDLNSWRHVPTTIIITPRVLPVCIPSHEVLALNLKLNSPSFKDKIERTSKSRSLRRDDKIRYTWSTYGRKGRSSALVPWNENDSEQYWNQHIRTSCVGPFWRSIQTWSLLLGRREQITPEIDMTIKTRLTTDILGL